MLRLPALFGLACGLLQQASSSHVLSTRNTVRTPQCLRGWSLWQPGEAHDLADEKFGLLYSRWQPMNDEPTEIF